MRGEVIYAASLSGIVALIIWLLGTVGGKSRKGCETCRFDVAASIMEAKHAEMQMESRRKCWTCVYVR